MTTNRSFSLGIAIIVQSNQVLGGDWKSSSDGSGFKGSENAHLRAVWNVYIVEAIPENYWQLEGQVFKDSCPVFATLQCGALQEKHLVTGEIIIIVFKDLHVQSLYYLLMIHSLDIERNVLLHVANTKNIYKTQIARWKICFSPANMPLLHIKLQRENSFKNDCSLKKTKLSHQ